MWTSRQPDASVEHGLRCAGVGSLLTSDDLDTIGSDAVAARDPAPYKAELVAAVEQGRLADAGDASYALGLAADIAERCHDEDDALALARRSIEAAQDTSEHSWARGRRADLLLRFGHSEEGMHELRALRPLLTRDPMASSYVIDALVENGQGELAEEWLTPAVLTATENAERATAGSDAAEDAWEIAEGLAVRRRWVRRDLGLPPDETDLLAEEMQAAHDAEPDLLFWPRAAFDALLAAMPQSAEEFGATWDEHRAGIERELQAADAEGDVLLVETATQALLNATVAGEDADAVEPGPLLEWPPGRNEPCWCGSRTKYKKCCLPRARD